jgi:hypothetical protein
VLASRIQQRIRLFPAESERLLRVDVFASPKSPECDLEMTLRGRQIQDQINVFVPEKFLYALNSQSELRSAPFGVFME